MARTDSHWIKSIGGYLKSAYAEGLNLLINGEDRYLNFNLLSGASGYGIRDNAGVMEYKDEGGSWVAFNTGGGGGGLTQEQVEDYIGGLITSGTGITVTYDDAGNVLSISLANEAYTTAEQSKVANLPADTNAALALKADASSLATVATSGDYNDLSNKPDLSVYDSFDQYTNLAAFPATGDANVIYVAQDTGYIYRWNGSGYSQMSAELALGSTSSTAHRGDHGAAAYTHSQLTSGNPHNVTAADIGVESGADVTDAENVEDAITGVTADTLTDTVVVPFVKSAALKKITWANIKSTLETYFDTVYQAVGSYLTAFSDDTSPTAGGDVDFATHGYLFTANSLGNLGATETLAYDRPFQAGTLDQNCTLTSGTSPSKVTSGVFVLSQDATGGRDVTIPANWVFPDGEPTWTDGTASQKIYLNWTYDSVNDEIVVFASGWYD